MNADVLSVSDFLISMPENHDLIRLKSRYETETKRYRMSIKAADDKEQDGQQSMFDHRWDIRYRQSKRYRGLPLPCRQGMMQGVPLFLN